MYLSRYNNRGLWIRLDGRVDSLRLKSGVDESELPRAPDYLRSGEWQTSESILMDAAVDSLILYCHVRLMGPSLRASVIDTYDLSTLEYVRSVLLDEPFRSATVLGNRIYAIQDATVVSYEFDVP